MKRKELEKLLGLLDQQAQNPIDFSGFSNPEEAKRRYKQLSVYRLKLGFREMDFSPYFVERVMGKINNLSGNQSLSEYLSLQFSRVMAYGFAAVIVVFMTLYFIHGQDSFGIILGNDNPNDINFISYLFYEF